MALENDWKLLTYITKSSIFDVTGVLDTPPTSASQIIMEKYLRTMLVVGIDKYKAVLDYNGIFTSTKRYFF